MWLNGMNNKILCGVAAVLLAGCTSGSATPAPAPSQKAEGPTVFLGDSITASWDIVPPDASKLRTLVPGEINAGVTGQLSLMMLDRLQHDVLDKHPARVVILAGTNDVSDFVLG